MKHYKAIKKTWIIYGIVLAVLWESVLTYIGIVLTEDIVLGVAVTASFTPLPVACVAFTAAWLQVSRRKGAAGVVLFIADIFFASLIGGYGIYLSVMMFYSVAATVLSVTTMSVTLIAWIVLFSLVMKEDRAHAKNAGLRPEFGYGAPLSKGAKIKDRPALSLTWIILGIVMCAEWVVLVSVLFGWGLVYCFPALFAPGMCVGFSVMWWNSFHGNPSASGKASFVLDSICSFVTELLMVAGTVYMMDEYGSGSAPMAISIILFVAWYAVFCILSHMKKKDLKGNIRKFAPPEETAEGDVPATE